MGRKLDRFVDDIYTRSTGKFVEGRTELDLLSDKAIIEIFKRRAKDGLKVNHYQDLTDEQKDQIREYYKGCPTISPIFHRVYAGRTGRFDVNYMPDDLYYGYIEPYYNDREAARYIDNKCYYYQLFEAGRQPDLVCMRIGSLWFDSKGNPVRNSAIPDIVRAYDGEMVLKIAENSEGGAGVYFLSEDDPVSDLRKHLRYIKRDVVVQSAVKQHPDLAKLHPESVNTIRVMSFLRPGGAQILASCVRVGAGGSRTDNLSSGGLFIGVGKDGKTLGIGAMHDGITVSEHPTLHYPLEGHVIPGIDKAHDMVRLLHPKVGKFRLASWDIAIDEQGDALLLETNVSLSVIADIQVCTGPLFGEDTKRILREVFGR